MLRHKIGLQPLFENCGKKPSRAWLALLIFTLALLILSVWGLELSGRDSPRVAGIAREMAVTSNYLIPRLNGMDFLEYPPMGYWPIALTLSLSKNPSDFLAYLPLAFLGTATVLITYGIGKKLAGERIGLMAGFILSTMPAFGSLHRHCRVDPALLFFITLSLYCFVTGYQASKKRLFFFVAFYLAMAGAFLSKGIIGVAIPLGTAVVFLIVRKDFVGVRKLLWDPGILLFLLPILLWVVSVWWLEGPEMIREVMRQSLWRFLSPSADHAKPFYFYFTRVFLAPMPWTLLLLVLLWCRWGPARLRERFSNGTLLGFGLVWCLTVFVGLSLASAKRTLYLGPIYPSFALLAALGWDRIREKFPKVKRLEVYGLVVIFFAYIGTCLLFISPSESKESLRPVFEAISRRKTNGLVYLVNPSETTRGASFFYLGEKTHLLSAREFNLGWSEDRPGTTLVIESFYDSEQLLSNLQTKGYHLQSPFIKSLYDIDRLLSNLQSRGYHLLMHRRYGEGTVVHVYSNGP